MYFTSACIQHIFALSACYKYNKHVAVLKNGALVQVPDIAQPGDLLTSITGLFRTKDQYMISRLCEAPFNFGENEKDNLLGYFNQTGAESYDTPADPTSITHCRFVVSAPDIWQGLYCTGVEARPDSELRIFAIH